MDFSYNVITGHGLNWLLNNIYKIITKYFSAPDWSAFPI